MIPPLRGEADNVDLLQRYVGGRCRIQRDETWVKVGKGLCCVRFRLWREGIGGVPTGDKLQVTVYSPASEVAIVRAQIANLPQSSIRIGHIGLSVHEGRFVVIDDSHEKYFDVPSRLARLEFIPLV